MLYSNEKIGNPKRQTPDIPDVRGAQSRAFRSCPQGLDRQTAEDSSFRGFYPRQVLPGIFLNKEMVT